MSCFVCDPGAPSLATEQPGRWLEARHACWRHCAESTLRGGVRVADYLEGSRAEGSGLNLFLNPVSIGATRCWFSSAAGGWAVFGELLPCSDFLGYFFMHECGWAVVLHRIHVHRHGFDAGWPGAALRK